MLQTYLLLVFFFFIFSILFPQNFQVWTEIGDRYTRLIIFGKFLLKSREFKGSYKSSRKNEMDIWGFEV